MAVALVAISIVCVAQAGLLVYLHYQNIVREDAWRLERTGLLQRIQAPEIAVVEQAQRPERKPIPVVSIEDDDAMAKVREERLNGAA